MRTTNTDCSFFQSLEDTLRYHFLPAITGKEAFSDTERALLALPMRLGGLVIEKPKLLPSPISVQHLNVHHCSLNQPNSAEERFPVTQNQGSSSEG